MVQSLNYYEKSKILVHVLIESRSTGHFVSHEVAAAFLLKIVDSEETQILTLPNIAARVFPSNWFLVHLGFSENTLESVGLTEGLLCHKVGIHHIVSGPTC